MDPPPPPPPPAQSSSTVPLTDDPGWPRRTAKACSNCRRDKVRCNGEKPCSGCEKKNLQCLDGCDPCRRARARCEKTGDRCTRCETKDLECTDEPSTDPFLHHDVQPTSLDRAKSACQNCRNDNKKCDDQRPCSRCVARSATCLPVSRRPKQARTRCEGCRKQNARCEDARPCQNCVTAGTECVNIIRQTRGCGTRAKAACISCRLNKIRCDGGRPCGACSRRKSECREQVCRRCAQAGVTECTHRPRRDQQHSDGEILTSPSTSNAPAPLPANYQLHWAVDSAPSMFSAAQPPSVQNGLVYPPVQPSSSLPHATPPTVS
ncbi:hypothetical protein C8R43DRAFT_981832 [Mycena crocata]|nr:hypothetical protein C8R43DRAFT_981832 [Mycena crocata]